MKINITLDLEPSEIPLANEIIATLRLLTANVRINQQGGAANSPAQAPPQHLQQPQRQPSASSQPPSPPGVSQAPPLAPAPQPQPPLQQALTPTQPQPQQHQQPPLQQNGRPVDTSVGTFSSLVRRLGDEEPDTQGIMGEISRLLSAGGDAAFPNFLEAFTQTVFSQYNKDNRVSVVPFVEAIGSLQDPWKNKTRDKVIPNVLKHLTVKRPLDVNRMDFFLQAEAFAALVNGGLIGIEGAVKTIVALLRKLDNRSAAVTMMGKTAELCVEQLMECDAAMLEQLRTSLGACNEQLFSYDLDYINDIMSWPPSGYSAQQPQVLRRVAAWEGHSDTIFALAYDAGRRRLISGAKDSQVLTWNEAGQRVGSPISLTGCFICAMDLQPRADLLLVGGVPRGKSAASASCVAAYRMTAEGATPAGMLVPPRDRLKVLSVVRALANADGFITGETMHKNAEGVEENVVRFYSTSSGASFDSLQPLSAFRGHTDMITAAAPFPGQPPLFITGSKDGQVLLWDHRAAAGGAAGRFNVPAPAGGANMVTCLDAAGHMLLCGSTNKHVTQWDLRSLNQGGATESVRALGVDDFTVLKLAIGASPSQVAITTFSGLYLADFSVEGQQPGMGKMDMELGADGKTQHYHDVKWAADRGTLFAGGISRRVDSFQLGPA